MCLFSRSRGWVDDSKLAAFMKEIEGKDVAELIAEGNAKLASVPSGGGGGGGSGGGGGGDAGAAEAARLKKKKKKRPTWTSTCSTNPRDDDATNLTVG